MKTKFFSVIVLFAIIVTAIIGCGGNDTTTGTETFTLSFNANGGTPQPQPQTIAKNGKASEPTPEPTKQAYEFKGWYKEEALTNQWNFATDTVTAVITLHAKWKALCTCNPKEHYLPCTCEAAGTAECTCTVIPRGYITDTDRPTLNVPIYQTAGVTDEDAITTTETIKTAYAGLTGGRKNSLAAANNFKGIWIVAGGDFYDNNNSMDMNCYFDSINGIVKIPLDTELTIGQVLGIIAIPLMQGRYYIYYERNVSEVKGNGTGDWHDGNTNIILYTPDWTRDGYSFLGWSTTPTGDVEYEAGSNYTTGSGASITLYAVWR